MAVVIPFAPRRGTRAASLAAASRETGAILFFTGVRYERPAEAPAAARPARRPARPRTREKAASKSLGQPA